MTPLYDRPAPYSHRKLQACPSPVCSTHAVHRALEKQGLAKAWGPFSALDNFCGDRGAWQATRRGRERSTSRNAHDVECMPPRIRPFEQPERQGDSNGALNLYAWDSVRGALQSCPAVCFHILHTLVSGLRPLLECRLLCLLPQLLRIIW